MFLLLPKPLHIDLVEHVDSASQLMCLRLLIELPRAEQVAGFGALAGHQTLLSHLLVLLQADGENVLFFMEPSQLLYQLKLAILLIFDSVGDQMANSSLLLHIRRLILQVLPLLNLLENQGVLLLLLETRQLICTMSLRLKHLHTLVRSGVS